MMAKLLNPADAADGSPAPGSVEATSVRALARFKTGLLRAPTLGTALAEQARQSRWWLAADAALVLWGVVSGSTVWIWAGLLAAAAPFVLTVWTFRHAQRYQRLLRDFAVGQWDAVRVGAKALRSVSAGKPMMDFDLDVRLAGIYARDHDLADALQRLAPWRRRWNRQPGHFEMGVAAVHLMAGDSAGFVAQMARAHELNPADPSRRLDHALAEARFGSVERAAELLAGLDGAQLPAHGQGLLPWATGLVQLRRLQPEAEATLGQAVAAFLPMSAQPAVWTALALCACDHAIAMHRAGRHDAARKRMAEVWPILEWHAPIPLLRMLEADGLLPERAHKNT